MMLWLSCATLVAMAPPVMPYPFSGHTAMLPPRPWRSITHSFEYVLFGRNRPFSLGTGSTACLVTI